MTKSGTKRSLKLIDWPPQEREAWISAEEDHLLFGGYDPSSNWSPGRRSLIENSYGAWLAWLHSRGELQHHEGPVERFTDARLRQYVQHLLDSVASVTAHDRVKTLRYALRVLAPKSDTSFLDSAISYLNRIKRPSRNKAIRIRSVSALVALGRSLMLEARARPIEHATAKVYRDGLMIALLAHNPIRLANFAGLELGNSLLTDKDQARIWIKAENSKSGRDIDQPIAPQLVPWLYEYLQNWRTELLRKGENKQTAAVWINNLGKRMQNETARAIIKARTAAAFGQPINPHLFRDCTATEIALHIPEQVGIIAPILGHSSPVTAERHYNQAKTFEAVEAMEKTINRVKSIR